MKAEQFLRNGADVLAERGKEYDKPEGERSMARTVAAFKAITGKELTEAEGWLFMECLKNVRQWQKPDRYHEDSAVDGVNYSALKAEALSEQKPKTIVERVKEYCESRAEIGNPDWKDAPEWAQVYLGPKKMECGSYAWAEGFTAGARAMWTDCSAEFRLGMSEDHNWAVIEVRP